MDSVTNEIVNEIKVEGSPQDIKVSADGNTLLVVVLNAKDEDDKGYILFYNIKDNKLVKKFRLVNIQVELYLLPTKIYNGKQYWK